VWLSRFRSRAVVEFVRYRLLAVQLVAQIAWLLHDRNSRVILVQKPIRYQELPAGGRAAWLA